MANQQESRGKAALRTVGMAFVLAVGWTAQPALAASVLSTKGPILGGSLLAFDELVPVTATYLGSSAGYVSTLYFIDGANDRMLFTKSDPVGKVVTLGTYAAGTELVFRLDVANTGKAYYTGGAERNPDGVAHAKATTVYYESLPPTTSIGFEDIFGGGDRDYNDFMFKLSNVVDPPPVPEVETLPELDPPDLLPELVEVVQQQELPNVTPRQAIPLPGPLALLGAGLLGLAYVRRRAAI